MKLAATIGADKRAMTAETFFALNADAADQTLGANEVNGSGD